MKGILFKPDMIQAIIEGRKTQTRRVIKPQPDLGLPEFDRYSHIEVGRYHPTKIDNNGEQYPGDEIFGAYTEDGEWGWRCPYPVGETVYIKEAWGEVSWVEGDVKTHKLADNKGVSHDIIYPNENADFIWGDGDRGMYRKDGSYRSYWKSPMMMPEWAARHFITITGVRAERLQEITEGDVLAEGIAQYTFARGCVSDNPPDPRWSFIELWDSINPKYPWESNPWVFAYTFRLKEGK